MKGPRGADRAVGSRSEWAWLVALLAGAGLVRWLAWQRSAVLFNDGPHFLAIAQAFDAGAFGAALGAQYHPLYPLAVWGLHAAGAGWEAAAAAVSIASGVAAVGLLFLTL